MDSSSVAYVLCRIEDDSSLTPVSQHKDIITGIAAGGYAVDVEDFEFAYALYSGATRVAAFRSFTRSSIASTIQAGVNTSPWSAIRCFDPRRLTD